jgi:pescadillo protein
VNDEAEGYVPKQREVIDKWIQSSRPTEQTPSKESIEIEENLNTISEDALEREFEQELREELSASKDEAEKDAVELQEKSIVVESAADVVDSNKELAKSMMSKKHKRLYSRMMHGIQKKQESQKNLMEKRRRLDADA